MNPHTRKYKRFVIGLKHVLVITLTVAVFGFLLYLNFYFKVRSINVIFFDGSPENAEIKSFTENLARKKANNFYNYLFLNGSDLTDIVHDEFKIVSKLQVSKDIRMGLSIAVSKNEKFFYTCMSDDSGFLARCMYGNTDGEYYEGFEMSSQVSSSSLIKIDINAKVLYDAITSKKIEVPDSLSGARIYTTEDFKVLREIVKWLQKNGFAIKSVKVDELKIVNINTEPYMIKINLEKGYVDTVKDFEIISRTGNLVDYINNKKDEISYIDLSYKDKVFYKLKKDIPNLVGSSTVTVSESIATPSATSTNTQ